MLDILRCALPVLPIAFKARSTSNFQNTMIKLLKNVVQCHQKLITSQKCNSDSSPQHVKSLLLPLSAQAQLPSPYPLSHFSIVLIPQFSQITPLALIFFHSLTCSTRACLLPTPKDSIPKIYADHIFLRTILP